MKHEFSNAKPEAFKTYWDGQYEVFNWAEFLMGLPMPLFVITTYKENGLPNACFHSWSTFTGDGGGHFIIMGGIPIEYGHTIKDLKRNKEFCINFPSKEIIDKCYATIEHNSYDIDEITENGLTVEKSQTVNAPRIKECFLNLECSLEWLKPLYEGSRYCIVCGRIKHIAMDDQHFDQSKLGLYNENGFLFNIHSPKNPLTGESMDNGVGYIKELKAQN